MLIEASGKTVSMTFAKGEFETPLPLRMLPGSNSSDVKLFVVVASIIAVGLSTFSAFEYRRTLAQWRDREISIAEDRAQLASNWLQERRGDAEANSRSP